MTGVPHFKEKGKKKRKEKKRNGRPRTVRPNWKRSRKEREKKTNKRSAAPQCSSKSYHHIGVRPVVRSTRWQPLVATNKNQ